MLSKKMKAAVVDEFGGSLPIDMQSSVRNWWIFLLSGLLLIALGILVLNHPLISYAGLSIYFVATFLINGVVEIAFSVRNHQSIPGWGWYLASGIFDVLIGILLLLNPILAAVSLSLFVGFWLMLRSIYAIGRSFNLKSLGMPDWEWLLVFALAGLIFSFMIMYNPAWGAISLITWTALALFTVGIFYIHISFSLKSSNKWIKHPPEKKDQASQ